MAIDHDRLFKELIQTFFHEFMEVFFAEVHESIDFNPLTFLSEELFTDLVAGERRRVDLLAETKLRGEEVLIIVHVEPQSYFQKDFAERMFIYSSRLFEKYRRRILPIAVFSHKEARIEPDSFGWGFAFLEVLKYRFFTLELQKCNWRQYVRRDNPVAAALLSMMGYTEDEKVQVKLEFLRMLVRMELDPARMHLITGFFDTYLKLNDREKLMLKEEIRMLDRQEESLLAKLQTQWEIDAKIEGKLEGKLEEARKFINKYLQAQFGEKRADMDNKIANLNDLEQLEQLADRLFRVSRLEEAQQLVNEACRKG
ncbi:Rpn family recombination-promoting nuclease/putative transposase [Paenibacillus sp. HJGM_3]|uniref:Rpn family recombination-promoting nuclease/putative transposase n=1 Tax=Paenibacillus sp. HJGM_3 TaxID=3379816 RepID=UPI00385E51D8